MRDACARWGRLRFAVDATAYPRLDAWCSPGREHVHIGACRCQGSSRTAPGWEYQLTAAIGHLRTAWAALADVTRTTPATRTQQTIAQVKNVLRRLRAAGHGMKAVPLFVFDAEAWHDVHPLIHGDRGWFAGRKHLPVLRCTLVHVTVERLPDGRDPHRAIWLWHAGPVMTWAMESGACWSPCYRLGRRRDVRRSVRSGSSSTGSGGGFGPGRRLPRGADVSTFSARRAPPGPGHPAAVAKTLWSRHRASALALFAAGRRQLSFILVTWYQI